jgi:hypothetical protein
LGKAFIILLSSYAVEYASDNGMLPDAEHFKALKILI